MAVQWDISFGLSIGAWQSVRRNAWDTAFEAYTPGWSGDVVWPASATDNAVARFDTTTWKLIQDSNVTIADTTWDITWWKYNTVAISWSSTPTLAVTWTTTVSWANTWDETESTLLSKLTVFADSKNNTGFYDNTNISVTYDKTTRTITLTRTGWVIYYFQWKKHTLTSPWTSSAHTNSAWNYVLYSTDWTTFSWSTTPWTFDYVMVALAIYDGADGWAIREVHGLMDVESHKDFHNNIGTWRSSGWTLTAGTYTENTATDAANSPWFDLAVVNDEDIATTIPAWTEWTYTTMYIWASSTATLSTVATLPFTSAWSYIQVNDATTGSLTAGIKNRYYNVYQILVPAAADTDSQKRRMIMLQPQATFNSLSSAQAEDPRSLSLGNFATTATEFTIYARITYITSVWDANTGKCRIATWWVSYVIWNRLSSSSLTGSPTNHAWLTNLSWTTSWHTGSNLWAPLFDSTGIATQVVPTASQSIRINAGWTAWEAYTPSSGVSWGTSINGATWTWLALSMDNSYAASGIGQSITIGNTQTQALTALKIDTWTSALYHLWLKINSLHWDWININSSWSVVQAVGSWYNIDVWQNFNTNSSFSPILLYLHVENNAGSWKNSWAWIRNYSTEFTVWANAAWWWIQVTQYWASWTGIALYGDSNVNSSTNGLVNYTLWNTQSWATVMQKIDLGTSAQGHTGSLVNLYNASTSARGYKVDFSTTWSGVGFEAVGSSPTLNYTRIYSAREDAKQSRQNIIMSSYDTWTAIWNRTLSNLQLQVYRINTASTGTIADNFNAGYIIRSNENDTAWWTITPAWSVLKLENESIQIAWTNTDTVNILSLLHTNTSGTVTGKSITAVVWATERFKVHPLVANSGTNNAYLFDTTTSLSWTTTLWVFANGGTAKFTIDNAGNTLSTWSITTAAPTTGTAAPWKLWTIVTWQVWLVLVTTQYIELDINWTLYKLATV